MWIVASWMPADPPSSRSVICVENRFDSAHIRYMRSNISAQSQASVPPGPAWIVTKPLQWSLGPPSIDRNSNELKSSSAWRHAVAIPSSNRRVSASSASSIVASRLSACVNNPSNGLRVTLRPLRSLMTSLAFSGSFQNFERAIAFASARRCPCLSPKSKRVSEQVDLFDHALGRSFQLCIHDK